MNTTQLSPRQLDYQKKIFYSANSLLRLIDDILDFSKIEAGRMVIESITFNFDEIFESLSVMAITRIGDNPIEFLYDFSPDIPHELKGDPYRIGQILTNFVSNAVKFTERGSVIVRVSVKEISDEKVWLRFVVEDTGIGISPDKLKTLFEPFVQADSSTTRKFGGTGLGLSICQKLCSLMGGSIGVESDPGMGSLFYFELPLGYSNTRLLSMPPSDLQNIKVLLVNDSPVAQKVLSDMLESMSFQVSIAGSGSQALVRLNEPDTNFDLVLLDWRLSGIDGSETARRIYEELDNEKRPVVIMMAAYDHEVMEQEINSQYLDGVLVNPPTPSLLLATIINAFESQSSDKPSFVASVDQQPKKEHLQGKVLLVEDNEINQQVAKELLEQMGLVVDTVDDGVQALRYIEQQRPDLVLMDIQMPVMDGYEATRRIRDLPEMSDLPIFAMTANALVGDADKSVRAGMNGHISKPIEPEELYRILSDHMPTPAGEKEKTAWIPPVDNPPGINLQRGILQVGGKPEFYLKLLRNIIINHANCISEIDKLVMESRLEDAMRVAHTIKGIAATIGAYEMQHVAAQLEVCLAGDEVPSQELLEQFSQTCRNLLAVVQRLIPDSGSSSTSQKEIKE
jgi:CheY-like chemotaxis protein/two-component sensor histidine kinase